MSERGFYKSSLKSVALIGNYLPRRCGIATFTSDLLRGLSLEAPDTSFWAIAMNDIPEGYPYPSEVRFEVRQRELIDYTLASDFLNMNNVDIVNLQHEYGIFGGDCGSNIINLLSNLRMPVVTTLHTVLEQPSDEQKEVLISIAKLSNRLVVMSEHAKEILKKVFGIPYEKIVMIHHGIPDVPFVDPNYYKDQFGVEGRRVILTFGLLSPNKGIEYMIDAMPEIVKRFPDCVYIILGATHPHVKKEHGESYRIFLQRKARELGVENHLIFHNRFVELKELCEFLGAADIYVTPYLNKQQIVSGTLAYSLGAGKAVISTPYWYAEEMLADGRGRIVSFRDSKALAENVINLFSNEVERHSMRKRAYIYCRNMIWKEVSRRYLDVFEEVRSEMEGKAKPVFKTKTLEKTLFDLPQPKLDHLLRLTDDVGILQHAKYIIPDRFHGYCTDDNARALIAVLMAQEFVAEEDLLIELMCKYLSFLHYAFNEKNGRFRNFMNYERKWLDEKGSDDSYARAIWALGATVGLSKFENIAGYALTLFKKSLSAALEFKYYHPISFSIIGIQEYLKRFGGDSEARRARELLASKLKELYHIHSSDDWQWVSDKVTWGSGKVAQALIMAGQWIPDNEMMEIGLKILEWLMKHQTDNVNKYFAPVGNNGWFEKNSVKARFDQQPIEALSMIEACREAYNVTREEKWISFARLCIEWFLGRNDANAPLYDYITGGCCDGLMASGINQNQGAESTLCWLISLFNMRKMLNLQIKSKADEKVEVLTQAG
ncbi:MAG: glycosyltransferase [Candidatus Schekmanbacteria bacterium]|nr:MAG: glycosyltransferase [Candidatus Schekmanbacteria bacterium]